MAIEQIQIRGFRSIRNLTLSLQQLNVVSGPNGCGKSNLYTAVAWHWRWLKKAAFRKRCGRAAYVGAIADTIQSGWSWR
jgi:predicted ATPase